MITEHSTVADAQAYILEHRHDGCRCPVCNAKIEIYKRAIHSTMAAVLCEMRRHEKATGAEAMNVASLPGVKKLPKSYSDFSKCRWWGLIEQMPGVRDDGSPRNGYWKLTTKGRKFVERSERVMKYALEFKSEALGFAGEMVTIDDCLGTRFRYDELVNSQSTLFTT